MRRRPPGRSVGYYKRCVALDESAESIDAYGRAEAFYAIPTTRTRPYIVLTRNDKSKVALREENALRSKAFLDASDCFMHNAPARYIGWTELRSTMQPLRFLGRGSSPALTQRKHFTNTALPRVGVERPNGSYVARTVNVLVARSSLVLRRT